MLLGVAATAVQSQELRVIGTGHLSCAQWLAAREQNHEEQADLFIQWVAGYFVAHNYYNYSTAKKTAMTPDLDAIKFHLDKFCRDNPTRPVFMAEAELVEVAGGIKALHNTDRTRPFKR